MKVQKRSFPMYCKLTIIMVIPVCSGGIKCIMLSYIKVDGDGDDDGDVHGVGDMVVIH